jgi:hypothetical protein
MPRVQNVWYSPAMLVTFRRHLESCRHKAKGRSHRSCGCPIHVEGTLRGEMIRKSLDVRNWEAAQKMVRDWEIDGRKEVITLSVAGKRFIADRQSRGLSAETIAKLQRLVDELEKFFGDISLSRIGIDEVGKFREEWKVRPSTARKKLERLRSFFKFCVSRKWIAENPASESNRICITSDRRHRPGNVIEMQLNRSSGGLDPVSFSTKHLIDVILNTRNN